MKLPVPFTIILGILGGAVLGAGGVLVYSYLTPESSSKQQRSPGEVLTHLPSFGKPRPAETATSVAALGRLTPQGEVIEVGGLMGDRLGELKVQEDDWVEQGAILGYLESHGERQAELDAFAAQLAEAKARLAAETAYADALIKEAEVGVRQAKEFDPLDVQAQEAHVRLLETEVATGQTDLDRLQSVTTPGAVPRQKLDHQLQLVRRARQELVAGQAALAKAKAGQPLNQERAQAQLEAARAGGKRAEITAQVASLTKNVALAEVRLERTVLRAARPGRVFKVLARPGERVDQKPILRLGDTRVMYTVAEVYETDILRVCPGQHATVTSPALPLALSGTVERVGRMIYKNDVLHVDPAANADARVVEVWIRLDSSDLAARLTNLQVDVVIEVGNDRVLMSQ